MTIDEHVKNAAGWLGRQCAESFGEWVLSEAPNTGSPLEEIFFVWWEAMRRERAFAVDPFFEELVLEAQHPVGRYRLDFRVVIDDAKTITAADEFGLPTPLIAVELDGHAFHEKTKEQVTLRNRRDRELQAAGWKVFHFSGTEMHKSPLGCVEQVMYFASREYGDLWHAVYEAKERRANAAPASKA